VKSRILTLLLGATLLALSARPAKAGIVVGRCIAGTQYSTIQAAVNAAPSGSIIKVCPGGYPEQVIIEKPLTLQGFISQGVEGALILSPPGGLLLNDTTNYQAQMLVKNTTGVTISNLIVDAAGNNLTCTNNPMIAGIVFHNASGAVNTTAVRNQVAGNSSSGGCSGYGVLALDDNQQPETVTVQNSDFRNNALWAIAGDGQGLTMNTLNNYVAGPDNSQLGGAGIVYFLGVAGTVQGNTVVNQLDSLGTPGGLTGNSLGIAVACSTAKVTGNVVSNTQLGIFVGCPFSNLFTGTSTVTQNKIFETKLGDGIYVTSAGNTITNNTIVASAESGIHLDTTYNGINNTVSGNTITEACTGILTTGKGSNMVSANTFNAVYSPTQRGTGCGPIF
jgi:parallel beta-helix repeat protein